MLNISRPGSAVVFGVGLSLLSGCASTQPRTTETRPSTDDGPPVVAKAPSPVPAGQTLAAYVGEETDYLHTEARRTNFVRSYKDGFMTKDQYTLNMVQRYGILKAVLDAAQTDPRLAALVGPETEDLFKHICQDLTDLGKPPASITESDMIGTTKGYVGDIKSGLFTMRLAAAYGLVGGAGNGGPRIAGGIKGHLGENTPVSGFSGTPHAAVESFDARINMLEPEYHQTFCDALERFYKSLNAINNDAAFGPPVK